MSSHLAVNTDALRETGVHLRLIASAFDGANARSATAGRAAGHPGLDACLEDLARSWEGRRGAIIEDIARLSDACGAMAATFEDIDASLGAALRGEL